MKLPGEEVLDAAGCGDLASLRRYDKDILTDNLCDSSGCNCLHYAARQGGADILEFLVKERGFLGYKRSNVGATAAHDAAAAGNLEALKWLLQFGGCSVDDQDGTGATVLHLAARFHHTDITEWLLDAKQADVSKRTASNGLPLHFAVVGGDYDAVKVLLDEDPTSVNYQLSNGATATYLAAQQGHLEILRLLIQDYRGNVKMKAYDGMSSVHAAAQSGHLDCVRFLVDEEKCNSNDRDFDGETPLHYAASQGHALVIDWLMKMGGAKVTLDNLGGSPLHNAAECNQIECAKVLISNGCSPEITDNNGLTAAELARKCYNEKCANLIETFQPQSQFLIDEDVAYLHSVQSPRPGTQHEPSVVTNGYGEYQTVSDVTNGYSPKYPSYNNTHNHQENHQVGRIVNSTQNQVIQVTVHSGTNQQDESRGRLSPVQATSPVNFRQGPALLGSALTDGRQEVDETGSVSARADSDEFPVGIPRNFSQDWSVEPERNQSGSSSSLSSLSHLDDAIAVATQEVERDKVSQNASVYRKSEKQMLLPTQNQNIVVEKHPYSSTVFQSQQINKRTDFLLQGPREPKSVKFQAKTSYIKPDSLKMDETVKEENARNERDSMSVKVSKTGNNTVDKEIVNSNGYHGEDVEESKVGNGVHENSGPVALFTAEMMKSQRSTLTPAQARTAIDNSSKSDFITELKQATKGPALRKTSKSSEPGAKPLTPALTFTSGLKTVAKGNNANGDSKDSKLELTGEWDPKNFVDKVPNRNDLPAWKVQLQARQIAEKAMKETLKVRKIEERESRFKNMPSWKRALVEKKEKEAEARLEEEKRLQEQQQQKKAGNKRVPAVIVQPKTGDSGTLAPWQQEVQRR